MALETNDWTHKSQTIETVGLRNKLLFMRKPHVAEFQISVKVERRKALKMQLN